MNCNVNKIVKSPQEKYTLKISSIETKPGCWNYTSCEVYDSSEKIVALVKRNYSSFPYLFIEDHPNGHDYLVCGEDYQGQTVVELDTGKIRNFLPEEAKQGAGFCWGSYIWSHEQQLLIVCGCYWAAPYEWRFYDFSDPMKGWPELTTDNDDYFYDSGKEPTVLNKEIFVYDSRDLEDDDSDEENIQVVAWKRYKRNGLILNYVAQWIDVEEEKRRKEQKERQEKWEQELKIYQSTDPLYLMVKNLEGGYFSTGVCYDGWCPDFKGKDARVCRRVVERNKFQDHEWTVDLEWGRNIAPVKLNIYRDGKTFETKFFPLTQEGMTQAISYYKELTGIQ